MVPKLQNLLDSLGQCRPLCPQINRADFSLWSNTINRVACARISILLKMLLLHPLLCVEVASLVGPHANLIMFWNLGPT